ncbi:MAG: pyruvate, phosphate dikinase, partial [Oscillospiraceae bacterium]|nr:pyruvate, phosphate dikinase [Oscillospiraceae bacterium]
FANKLENHYKDMQDMEFTIEKGKLYMLQTRNGKRTVQAALKIAVDMVAEGMCLKEDAILKVDPKQLDALLHPQFDQDALEAAVPAAKGLPASPGAACGRVTLSADDAVEQVKNGPVLLVRHETSPEDIEGMNAALGILTSRGGMTSHAAVVARGMGTCCVAGCADVIVNEEEGFITVAGARVNAGEYLSIDGSTGNIYIGKINTREATIGGDFDVFMKWADEFRTLKVRTNADTPADAVQAISFGAEGIGLTRTEHMFFAPDRINNFRHMILAKDEGQRRTALATLLPMQRADFEGIFEAMAGRPVTIRLLDPPLHEFLPKETDAIESLAKDMGMSFDTLKQVVDELHEANPMMGHRGCRLAVSYPEIAEMQARAITEAAINVNKKSGFKVTPEIMIPLVGDVNEMKFIMDVIEKTAEKVMDESGQKLDYLVGTMIELPRAALTAGEIAEYAHFFSFGTNDMTQMTYGFSRDDAAKFLDGYYNKKIFEFDPFTRFDTEGTGKLVEMAVKLGRQTRPDIKLGVCGEHGGDPASVEFFHKAGLEYVSCSPFRVPIARLAAAQAAINEKRGGLNLGQK